MICGSAGAHNRRADGTVLGQGRYAHIWLLDENGNWELDRDLWSEPPGTE